MRDIRRVMRVSSDTGRAHDRNQLRVPRMYRFPQSPTCFYAADSMHRYPFNLLRSLSRIYHPQQQKSSMSTSIPNKIVSPPIPRLSACLVVINERNEVLLVQRNPHASAFGGVTVRFSSNLKHAHRLTCLVKVFPGGNFDSKQDSSLEMTAIRETFEESGLLIASPSSNSSSFPSDSVLDEARFAVHDQKKLFVDFLNEHGLKANTESLHRFTSWITPVGPPK